MNRMGGAAGGIIRHGQQPARKEERQRGKLLDSQTRPPNSDVARRTYAVREVPREVRKLGLPQDRPRYKLGARIPACNVLLYTALRKRTQCEPAGAPSQARKPGVPFLMARLDFVEMFVAGALAPPVRDLFSEAKKNAPNHHLHLMN